MRDRHYPCVFKGYGEREDVLPPHHGVCVCSSFSFRTKFERGIVNYPFEVEDYTDERTPCLISVIFVRQRFLGSFGCRLVKVL